jgi:hypothetical protein
MEIHCEAETLKPKRELSAAFKDVTELNIRKGFATRIISASRDMGLHSVAPKFARRKEVVIFLKTDTAICFP